MAKSAVSQHKLMAMGKGTREPVSSGGNFAKGGGVGNLKTGIPDSPITKAKMANGVPGFKKGGKAC